MRISNSKFVAMVLNRRPMDLPTPDRKGVFTLSYLESRTALLKLYLPQSQSSFQPSPLPYPLWAMTEGTRFLRKVVGWVRSSVIHKELCTERSHLKWFWHLRRCHQDAFLGRCSWHVQLRGSHRADRELGEEILYLHWPWNLGIS